MEYVRPRSKAQRDVEDAVAKERNPIIKHNKTLVMGTARNQQTKTDPKRKAGKKGMQTLNAGS